MGAVPRSVAIATTNIARDVWHKLRVLESNGTFIIYVDAAQIGATTLGLTSGQYVGFVTQWSLKVDFRNLKGWRIPLPAQPA